MAAVYLDADVMAVTRLAQLHDEHTRNVRGRRASPSTLLGEIRNLEDRLGLTPLAVQRLQWSVLPEPAVAETDDEVAERRARFDRLTDDADPADARVLDDLIKGPSPPVA